MGRILAALVLFSILTSALLAQAPGGAAAGAEVEVRDVSFDRARDRAGDEWWRATVELEVSARGGGMGRFADMVRVQFNVAFQPTTRAGEIDFYRAAVTAPVLEAGRHQFQFYLPPALVRRDRLSPSARFWTVGLTVDGSPQPLTVDSVSRDFSGRPAVDNFLRQLEQAAPSNDGVMLPQHLSPWALEADTPAVVRPEAYSRDR